MHNFYLQIIVPEPVNSIYFTPAKNKKAFDFLVGLFIEKE